MNTSKILKIIYILAFLFSTSSSALSHKHTNQLIEDKSWDGNNRNMLNTLINQNGINSLKYNPQQKPVAAFDWDNTIMKNDIGEATLLWMMTHGSLKRPASFKEMNPWLSSDALQELEKNCSDSSEFLPTKNKPECADTLLNIYHSKALENGTKAWNSSTDPERIFPPYFFYAQLFAGYTPKEISLFTQQALNYNLSNKIGTMQKVGTQYYPAYVRLYPPMKNLIAVLQDNGFDVWIISASLQPSVEVVAKKVGIKPDHVIGVRQTLTKNGRLTDSFQGCGPFLDNNKEIISNRLGKRCWLNKVVFKLRGPEQISMPVPVAFAAGDSEGDLVFLQDATKGRLVINKNNTELLCYAYQNLDGKWLINSMFIQPKPVNKHGYKCSPFHIPDQFEVEKSIGKE